MGGQATEPAATNQIPAKDINIQIKEVVEIFRPLFKLSLATSESKNNIKQGIDRLNEWIDKGSQSVDKYNLRLLREGFQELHDAIPDGPVDETDSITVPHSALLKICAYGDILDKAAQALKAKDVTAEDQKFIDAGILGDKFQEADEFEFAFNQPEKGETFTSMGQKLNTVNDRFTNLFMRNGLTHDVAAAKRDSIRIR